MRWQIAMIMVLLLIPVASADLVTTGSALDVDLLYYQPVPAQPGDELDVWIQISNDGGDASRRGTIEILDGGVFSVETGADMMTAFPAIPGQESFLFKTQIRVSKDASEGTNSFKVRVQEGNSGYIEEDLTISIEGTTSALSIISVKSEPEKVMPGETAHLEVTVKNVGETSVRNVDVALDLDDLNLAPSGSSDSKTIPSLRGGQKQTFTFDLIVFPAAAPNAYQIPITLSYDDERENEKSQEETVGFIVGTIPELLVYFDAVDLDSNNNEGEVTIQFVNKGLAEIKLLEFEVVESDDVEVTSESSVVYVGNIDEDDYESAQIMLKVSGDGVEVPLKVTYRDALNKQFTEDISLTVHLKESNGNSGTNWGVILLVVVVVALLLWFFFKRRRRKK